MSTPLIKQYIKESFESLSHFSTIFDITSTFNGFYKITENLDDIQYLHYIIIINNIYYDIIEVKQKSNNLKKFFGIYQLQSDFFSAPTLRQIQETFNFFAHKKFAVSLDVNCVFYSYETEKKFLINQSEKIDLLFSISLKQNNLKEFSVLEVKDYPSLEKLLKQKEMMKILEERCKKIIEDKKK